ANLLRLGFATRRSRPRLRGVRRLRLGRLAAAADEGQGERAGQNQRQDLLHGATILSKRASKTTVPDSQNIRLTRTETVYGPAGHLQPAGADLASNYGFFFSSPFLSLSLSLSGGGGGGGTSPGLSLSGGFGLSMSPLSFGGMPLSGGFTGA